MNNALLCSPDFIRSNSNISDNCNSKVLATAIREVQEDELQEIMGEILIDKLKNLVVNGEIDNKTNKIYKDVLDKAQMFIVYKVIAEITIMFSCKIDNAGVIQTRDENMDYMDLDDTMRLKDYYDTKASHYAYLLQNFLLENMSQIPELTECQCWKIHSTLYSAATPNVFLGGVRGKGIWKTYPYRYQFGNNFPNRKI